MKLLAAALLFTVLATASDTHAFDYRKAHSAMRSITPWILSLEGVAGIWLNFCPSPIKPSEYCIAISTETEVSYNKLLQILPPGSNRNGVYILIEPPEVQGCGR